MLRACSLYGAWAAHQAAQGSNRQKQATTLRLPMRPHSSETAARAEIGMDDRDESQDTLFDSLARYAAGDWV